MLVRVTFITVKCQYFSVKPCVLTEFVLRTPFFDKRCNELEVWLKKRGYTDKLVREQILKARKFSTSEVLNKGDNVGNNNRFVFNVTYHPVLSKRNNVLSEIIINT